MATRSPLALDARAAITMAKLFMLSLQSFIAGSPVRSARKKSTREAAIPSSGIGAGAASIQMCIRDRPRRRPEQRSDAISS